MGGEVIADALVSGTLGIDAGAGAGVGAGTGAGAGAGAGTGVGAAQAQLRMPNSNIRGISISGTIDFIFIFWNNGIVNA